MQSAAPSAICSSPVEVAVNELTKETQEQLLHALGKAAVKLWSNLPHDIQQVLFEQTVLSQGERIRQQLALFLHEKHSRTSDAMKARATPEPDSLGG